MSAAPTRWGPPVVVYLGLGSNLGNRQRNIERAVELLRERVEVERVSAIYESPPVGYVKQPHFLNAVCKARTGLSPLEFLPFAQEIEGSMGRIPTFPSGPRSLDIDILLYGDLVLATPQLTIPHPRMAERAFVLVPLAEIDPEARHPVLGRTARELLAGIGGAGDMVPFDAEAAYWRGLKRGRRPVPPRVPP